MKRVFVDSGGFFAHLVAEDSASLRARQIFEQARADSWDLVTTNAVVYEAHALVLNRVRNGRAVALSFLEALEQGLCHVERVTADDEAHAIGLLRTHSEKAYSLCDALSFVVMERLRIGDVIAFDRHFAEYGRFTIL